MSLSLDATILKNLRRAPVWSAPEDGEPSGLIAERIAGLRAAGYVIEEDAPLRYRLVSAPDRLIADDLAGMLENCALARQILVFAETGSTNDVAARLGREGVAEGVVVFAETQTAGRGRLGRTWASATGAGLWFSILLRPAGPRTAWTRLSSFAAVSLALALEEVLGQPAAIKWPNDLYIGEKKVAGILIETHGGENGFAVLGMGVNVNQTHFPEPLAQRAVSLRQLAGQVWDRQRVAVAILRRLDAFYPKLDEKFGEIVAAAEQRHCWRGRQVEWEDAAGRSTGVVEGLDENGALILRKPDGTRVILSHGGASLTLCQP